MSLEQSLERIAIALEKLAGATMHIASTNPSFRSEPVGSSTDAPSNDVAAAAAKKAAAAKAKADKAAEAAKIEAAKIEAAKSESAEEVLPYDVLRANVIKLAAAGSAGHAAATKVLAEFGVKKASEAPDTKWAAMNDRILEEIAAVTAPPANDFA